MIIVKSFNSNEYRRPLSGTSKGPASLFDFIEYAENSNKQKDIVFEKDALVEIMKKTIDKPIVKYFKTNNTTFLVTENNEAHYLLTAKTLENPREDIWFYENLLKSKKYIPYGKVVTEFFEEKIL